MRHPLSLLCLLVVLALGAPASAADDAGAALREGIALLEAGDLDQAAQRLQDAVARLGADAARARDLGTAHLYLAMAQLGRGQADSARAHMREAWTRRKGARLDPRTFPPRVVALYDEVGAELRPPRKVGTKALAGVGAAGAVAGALVGASVGGSTPAPAAPPAPPTLTSVRVFNSDDVGRVSLNGEVLLEMGLGQDSGAVDISAKLSPGANELVFELLNAHGAISYGFEVRRDGAIVFQETCGLVLRGGCEDDRKFPPGVIRRYVYALAR
jgi:hypothetical protein